MTKRAVAAAYLALAVSSAAMAEPTTSLAAGPAVAELPVSKMEIADVNGARTLESVEHGAGLGKISFRVRLKAGAPPIDVSMFSTAIRRIAWQLPGSPDTLVSLDVAGLSPVGEELLVWCNVCALSPRQSYQLNDQMVATATEGLRAFLIADDHTDAVAPVDLTNLKQQLKELIAKGEGLQRGRKDAISMSADLERRLGVMSQQMDQLKLEGDAKAARQKALVTAIAEQQKLAEGKLKTDTVLEQRREIVKLRQLEAQAVAGRYASGQGVASQSEVAQANIALAEARVALAEREEFLRKNGKTDVLDKLADELTMVSVDVTELSIRIEKLTRDIGQQRMSFDLGYYDDRIATNLEEQRKLTTRLVQLAVTDLQVATEQEK